MADNLFEKVDGISDKVDDINERLDILTNQINSKSYDNIKTGNKVNKKQLVTDFIQRSSKEYIWFGAKKEFNKQKKLSLLFLGILFVVLILANIFTSLAFNMYTTFSFIEDIWFIMMLVVMKKVICLTYNCDMIKCTDNSIYNIEYTSDHLAVFGGLKKRYIVVFVLVCISAISNIIVVWNGYSVAYSILSTFFELAIIGISIVTFFVFVSNLMVGYMYLKFTGLNNSHKEIVTLIGNPVAGDLYLEEDFNKQFPFD